MGPRQLTRLLFWAGGGSALFACLDFYFPVPGAVSFRRAVCLASRRRLPSGAGGLLRGEHARSSLRLPAGHDCCPGHCSARPADSAAANDAVAGATVGISALVLSFSRAAMLSLVHLAGRDAGP